MILKICRQKQNENSTEGKLITEIYSGDKYKEIGGIAEIGDIVGIPLTDYDMSNPISNEIEYYKILNVYLMNNEGKTIEKLI